MLVTRDNFSNWLTEISFELAAHPYIACDTETTALFWWSSPHYAIKPRVFSVQLSTETRDFYFDFGCEESIPTGNTLDQEHFDKLQFLLFSRKNITWFIHNAKFDMHHLANHGIDFKGTVHCTQAIQRLVNNLENPKGFSLDALAEKYLGAGKIDLSEFWKDGARTTKIKRPGDNGKFYDFLHYDQLPLDTLVEYGERDTRLCYQLGMWQLEQIKAQNEKYFASKPSNFGGDLYKVLENEYQLTKTLFKLERNGFQMDMPFVKEALAHAYKGIKDTLAEIDPVAAEFVARWNEGKKEKERLATMDWNSGPMLKGLFESLGIPYAYTEKGSASFDKDALEKSKHPLAGKILEYRRHSKRAHTYLENYVWLADTDGVLHCSFAQGGTETGRLSCREPNMQNVPKRADKKETDFILRRCFVPRAGKFLVSCDFDQAEYRMMLDYAREEVLIRLVLDEGLNVHEATNQELKLGDYDAAKTMNFMLLYGGGVPKLAEALFDVTLSLEQLKAIWFLHKWPRWRDRNGYAADKATVLAISKDVYDYNLKLLVEAETKLNRYFSKLPMVQKFVVGVKDKAKKQRWLHTWLGRILKFTDTDGNDTSYKGPNSLCQGGVGDLGKKSLNDAHDFLREKAPNSHIVLHVHDELVAEVDEKELHVIPGLVKVLSECYPHRMIPITAGAAYSTKSWGDLEDGYPDARN